MKDNAVTMINAEELLEWLRKTREQARNDKDGATDSSLIHFYDGAVLALWEVANQVKRMNYLVSKQADTEEEV